MILPSEEPIRSVLLVQAGALGDTVLQLRIAEGLRRAWPAARITWLGRDGWLGIGQRCSGVDEAVGLDGLRGHRLWEVGTETPADLAAFLGRFDLIVNGLAGPDSAVMQRLERFARRAAVWYEPRPPEGAGWHVCGQWIEQLAGPLNAVQAGVGDVMRMYAAQLESGAGAFLEPRAEGLAEAGERLRAAGVALAERSRLMVVHPGSGGSRKCYPIERYVQVCRMLLQKDLQPVMVLGPAEVDRWGEQLGRLVRHCKVMIDPPVESLVALVRMAAAYVGNDSGPTHAAAAAGTATVALFGPTNPTVWAPLGPRVTVLRSHAHEQGWADVTAERVAAAVAEASRR